MTVSVEVPGAIITKPPNVPLGVELGMSEAQITNILQNSGYLEKPKIMTITNNELMKSDCGDGNPILFKTYKRDGEYDGKKVEYVFKPVFSDNIQDGKCEYQLKSLNPVEVREPSYMKEIK